MLRVVLVPNLETGGGVSGVRTVLDGLSGIVTSLFSVDRRVICGFKKQVSERLVPLPLVVVVSVSGGLVSERVYLTATTI